ncbi:MAG: L-serine ammonia-lyase, iron-sulfur-dependent, subunit alpha, partial [Pygmaiobacter sp.]
MCYNTVAELLAQCRDCNVLPERVILENEKVLTGHTEDEIYAELEARYAVMCASATKALDTPQQMVCGLIEGQSAHQQGYAGGSTLSGAFLNRIMAMAFSCSEVNASMGRICAAPTAGSCGILPAVLLGLEQEYHVPRRAVLNALL